MTAMVRAELLAHLPWPSVRLVCDTALRAAFDTRWDAVQRRITIRVGPPFRLRVLRLELVALAPPDDMQHAPTELDDVPIGEENVSYVLTDADLITRRLPAPLVNDSRDTLVVPVGRYLSATLLFGFYPEQPVLLRQLAPGQLIQVNPVLAEYAVLDIHLQVDKSRSASVEDAEDGGSDSSSELPDAPAPASETRLQIRCMPPAFETSRGLPALALALPRTPFLPDPVTVEDDADTNVVQVIIARNARREVAVTYDVERDLGGAQPRDGGAGSRIDRVDGDLDLQWEEREEDTLELPARTRIVDVRVNATRLRQASLPMILVRIDPVGERAMLLTVVRELDSSHVALVIITLWHQQLLVTVTRELHAPDSVRFTV